MQRLVAKQKAGVKNSWPRRERRRPSFTMGALREKFSGGALAAGDAQLDGIVVLEFIPRAQEPDAC